MLTSKERAILRKEANGLDPVFQVGKGEIDEMLIRSVVDCLAARELIKLKVLETSAYSAREAADLLAEAANCDSVQVIGSKFVLYKQKEKDKENIEFLGIDTIMTERLVALHTRVDMRKLTDEEISTLFLLRKVWLYTYTFFNSGNIVDTKEFLELNLEIKRVTENDNDDVTRLLLISYNYLLKVIKYSKDDSKQKRKLNFFMKISKT